MSNVKGVKLTGACDWLWGRAGGQDDMTLGGFGLG